MPATLPSEELLDYTTSCLLPTPWAQFTLHAFVEHSTGKEHLAMTLGDISNGEPVLARVHSECLTGDVLFSQRCDCGAQLEGALKKIADEGRGILLYLRQEGRGIGLVNKIRAYRLQEAGADTVEANLQLGFHADARNYELCKPMLAQFDIKSLRLMTNNPRKIDAMEKLGVKVSERVPLLVNRNAFNNSYLNTKEAKLGHMMQPQLDAVVEDGQL
ncbi:GTP cyclohydrolase II [Massilia sp. GCM10020059]|uniref:GTP cyclohydrolase-2 n=1 Tax=Massilia agrisoli TaxID=2892444 RepID=A0ABS8ISZ8_9BURK|nr:GTP cyclohydrolase II [Massilia agrisoli]MCC6071792.1 GTP cyclohydrolase II [Massilia agrisoli]